MSHTTKTIGSFYMRLTPSGNLTGEYINKQNSVVFTESADRKKRHSLVLKEPSMPAGRKIKMFFRQL